MKVIKYLIPSLFWAVTQLIAVDPSSLVILDEIGVKNLKIETIEVEEQTFEKTVFAIGRIEEIPSNRFVLSSRISGRVVELFAHVGDVIQKGDPLVLVESRLPGDPPPLVPLKAPQSGMIINTHVRLGEPVEPDIELMDISNRSEVWAVAQIPEREASAIHPSSQARIVIPALGDQVIEATLLRFGVNADRSAGSIEGIFQIDNKEGLLLPGMRAEFSIITEIREDVVTIPKSSIQGDLSKRVVFVKDFDLPNAFIRVPVLLGEQNDEVVEVLSGLFPGDELVTRGSYSLSFAGGGGGISLKEALDAAHGHEHNEDGSELSPEQKKAQEIEKKRALGQDTEGGGMSPFWIGYSVIASLLAIFFAQAFWNQKKGLISKEK
jgi:multidrug efflux pump subunit AcrA (membrane-fusion protein)